MLSSPAPERGCLKRMVMLLAMWVSSRREREGEKGSPMIWERDSMADWA